MRRRLKATPTDSFSVRVVRAARSVPPGRVTTYGRIAKAAGGGGMAAQSITSILSKAWDAGMHDIPFHRIVYADGRIWIDDKHRKERMQLYKKEGIKVDENDRIKDFHEIVLDFE
jgi:methylated-DNA-protein-cysteine methyltransferase-like protein